MAKISKKKNYRRGKLRVIGKRSKINKEKRSKTMKKAKKGGSIKKMMADSQTKPRQVYCFKCQKKVTVTNYEIKKTARGAYQVAGECSLHPGAEKPVKVFGFIKSSDV